MQLREAKQAEEVEAVRRACAAHHAAYDELWAGLEIGHTEAETNARVAYLLARRGATHTEPHILFGTHAARPARLAGRARARGTATSSAPTSPRSSTATGAT